MTRTFFVPGPPQGKARARVALHGKFARAYTPEKTASYESLIKAQYHAEYPGEMPWRGPLTLSIRAWFDVPKSTAKKHVPLLTNGTIKPTKKPDADNIAKVVCDALNGIAYGDDTQIVRLVVEKWYGEKPGVDVIISSEQKEA